MFVWRKRASAVWLAANEAALRKVAGLRLAIVSRPGRKNAIAEIAGSSQQDLERIRTRLGSKVEKLSRDWLKKLLRSQKSEPIKIANRLTIYQSSTNRSRNKNRSLLIPAGVAFGTGEHTTTAMALRLLERCTRFWGTRAAGLHSPKTEWALLDLGTGSGILALAAARFEAKRVIAIDHDPIAIATAKANARRNEIDNIDFRVADLRQWKFPQKVDVIVANLFRELLIEILPKLKRARCLILSGILREQAAQLDRALKRNGIAIVETRRRGKWIALVCHPESSLAVTNAMGKNLTEHWPTRIFFGSGDFDSTCI